MKISSTYKSRLMNPLCFVQWFSTHGKSCIIICSLTHIPHETLKKILHICTLISVNAPVGIAKKTRILFLVCPLYNYLLPQRWRNPLDPHKCLLLKASVLIRIQQSPCIVLGWVSSKVSQTLVPSSSVFLPLKKLGHLPRVAHDFLSVWHMLLCSVFP
jgi:hypothetical protein